MVQFANIFCSLGSFELFPSLGAIFKQYQVTNHLGDKNLPIILKLQTKKEWKAPKTLKIFLENSFTLDTFKLFFPEFFLQVYIL